ncbi:MAG: DUF853 family protein, partial [Verrucomicrobia bacterium]|nr:DUF853 family protein [Verrucomicrobiota bacterium]
MLEPWHADLEQWAAKELNTPLGQWAHAALLELAGSKGLSPETREFVEQAIDLAWLETERRLVMMEVAASNRNHVLDDRIRVSLNDPDEAVAQQARRAARRLRIEALAKDTTALIQSLSLEQALVNVVQEKGDPALGEAIFMRASCQMCHTINQDQEQKGPYLGNIANTYRREDLAKAILMPGNTIAQGFATHVIELSDGEEITGFVVQESGEEVVV